jgi:ABC-type dipeptide/oligopeptide/nickel transport system permease subunit
MLAVGVSLGTCVVGDSQYVGGENARLLKSVVCFVFVVQIESKALVESELNFLGVGGKTPTPSEGA